MHISGQESGIGSSTKSFADNGVCVDTGEATTGSVIWLMASVTIDAALIIAGMLYSLGKLGPPKLELRAAASILQRFDFVK